MNDKTTEQIAEEAAEKCAALIPVSFGVRSHDFKPIIQSAIEQARLEIWRTAPDQPDVQEAVIKKLDLVHQSAIEKAVKKNDDSWFAHKQGKHIPEYLRAAHASEPWKYDIDGTDGYIRIHPMHNPEITLFWITELAQAKKCVNAHNQCRAVHATEQEKAAERVREAYRCEKCGAVHDGGAHASEPDILQRLQYIADSPPSDYGGFHEQAIQTVKDAIEYINSHASNEKK